MNWAGLGGAYPNWMHDYTIITVERENGNYMRWMHMRRSELMWKPAINNGIVEVCPAGDKERDGNGRQWEQRVEVIGQR